MSYIFRWNKQLQGACVCGRMRSARIEYLWDRKSCFPNHCIWILSLFLFWYGASNSTYYRSCSIEGLDWTLCKTEFFSLDIKPFYQEQHHRFPCFAQGRGSMSFSIASFALNPRSDSLRWFLFTEPERRTHILKKILFFVCFSELHVGVLKDLGPGEQNSKTLMIFSRASRKSFQGGQHRVLLCSFFECRGSIKIYCEFCSSM